MKITELLLAELDGEAVGIRKTLERVPEAKNDRRRLLPPYPRGRHGGKHGRIRYQSAGRCEVQAAAVEDAQRSVRAVRKQPKKDREVQQKTTDDRLLNTTWRMLAAGKVMSEQTRYVAIRDGVLNHMAHHRGQLTVYLRLNERKVPAIYGPSADEGKE